MLVTMDDPMAETIKYMTAKCGWCKGTQTTAYFVERIYGDPIAFRWTVQQLDPAHAECRRMQKEQKHAVR